MLEEWDDLVDRAQVYDVAQLSAWAEIRMMQGYQPRYLFVREGGALVGGAQILCRRIPGLGVLGYLPYGPVICPGENRAAIRDRLAGELTKAGGSFRMLFVQPPVGDDDVSGALLAAGCRPSDALIAPSASLRLDLTVPEADLVRQFPRRMRTWTRQWANRGVHVRVGDSDDVVVLARLLAETAAHQHFKPFSEHYLQTLYDKLAPRGNVVLLLAKVEGRYVAAELFTACGKVVTARLCGLDRDPAAARLNVANAVTWEGIRWAKAHGYHSFDFGGIRPETVKAVTAPALSDTAIHTADQAKMKFGGNLVEYPGAVELVSSPVIRALYDFARRRETGRRLVTTARNLLRGAGR